MQVQLYLRRTSIQDKLLVRTDFQDKICRLEIQRFFGEKMNKAFQFANSNNFYSSFSGDCSLKQGSALGSQSHGIPVPIPNFGIGIGIGIDFSELLLLPTPGHRLWGLP